MFERSKLSAAVASALAVSISAGTAQAQMLEEIIVTATKRAESMQDVPISIQALGGESLKELRVETFDRYVAYLPNVVNAGNGPGKKEIYIRGTATEQSSVTVGPAQGSAPGVALYLDEMPVSFGARNLDIYAADLERIEVLAGPQGTLFGASSQSGTVRLITNKPSVEGFDAGFNSKFSSTSGGGESAAADVFVNIPLSDKLAVRATIYSDNQGGWIDNVPSTFTPSGAVVDRNSLGFGPALTGADSVATARNDTIASDDWNDASYRGVRLGLKYDINDDWDILVQHTEQTLDVDGSFLSDPSLGGDSNAAKFIPETNKDEFGLTTWTLNGRVANLDIVYTGGFLDRDVSNNIDYTHYNNGGGYITYYLCSGNVYDATDVNNCFDPTKQYAETTTNERTTHEFRISTDPDNRWRAIGGLYYNDVETTHIGEFQYLSTNAAFEEQTNSYYNDNRGDGFLLGNTTIPNTSGTVSVGPRSPATVFFNDFTRTEDEFAIFGEFAFDFTDTVSARVSGRYYKLTSELEGASNFSFGCRYGAGGFGNSDITADGRCDGTGFSNDVTQRLELLGQANATGDLAPILAATSPNGGRDFFRGGGGAFPGSNQAIADAITSGGLDISNIETDGSTEEDDIIVKATIDWRVTDDIMLFGTYSEGYRPATQNRNAGRLAANQTGVYLGYRVPTVALTDTLTNFEFGMKGEFLEGALRLNATLFFSEIDNLQVSRFDPSNVAFLVFMENIGDAEITGLDADFQWAATENLTITGAFSILDTELTRLNPQLDGVAVPVGSELPLSSDFSGNIRARYDFPLTALGGDGYVSVGVNYKGDSAAGIVGSAAFLEDTLLLATGRSSGLEIQNEGGNFGTVDLSTGGLPSNSRYVNPASTTINLSAGVNKDSWTAELFVDNVGDEEATFVQTAGKFTPEVTNQRPRTVGLRVSYDFE
ncbi:MAG: TonB-dependent receptor [Pseudomonadales bacterium]